MDFGFNLIDTADMYSAWAPGNKGGESETIIGKWLKKSGKRDKVILATKVGMEMKGVKGLKREHIFKSVEESLSRLQTDTIDLYQAHEDDKETPQEETLAAFDQLVKQGKVRAIGASNFTANRLSESLLISERSGFSRYVSLQPYYNLYDRERFKVDLESLCVENHLGVLSYFSLAKGFLTGKYRSAIDLHKSQRGSSGVARYLEPRGFKILQALDNITYTHQTTPVAVALAWLMRRQSVTAAIASATSVLQLTELAQSVELHLTAPELQVLEEASAY